MFNVGNFAKMVGVTPTTLRRWHKEGKLIPCKVTSTGNRYYSQQQLDEYFGKTPVNQGKIAIYARVSSNNQKNDLLNQLEFLKQYSNAKGYITEVYTDIGSGLNYKRKSWNALLKQVKNGEIKKIIIAHKDRFIRFGFDWFYEFCLSCGCEIEVVNNDKLSPQQEMIQDLISIIHVFSCRIYGLRKYKQDIKNAKVI